MHIQFLLDNMVEEWRRRYRCYIGTVLLSTYVYTKNALKEAEEISIYGRWRVVWNQNNLS